MDTFGRLLTSPSKPTSRRFNPTRLATTLTSSSPPLPTSTAGSSGPQEGFIILETNYRVYAYTGISICLIIPSGIFSPSFRQPLTNRSFRAVCVVKVSLPEPCCRFYHARQCQRGPLQRYFCWSSMSLSVFEQLVKLMISSQFLFKIISYLVTHAHPQMRKNASACLRYLGHPLMSSTF